MKDEQTIDIAINLALRHNDLMNRFESQTNWPAKYVLYDVDADQFKQCGKPISLKLVCEAIESYNEIMHASAQRAEAAAAKEGE